MRSLQADGATRWLLLATVVAGVLLGLWIPSHSHKILVSAGSGILAGWLWSGAWRRAARRSPDLKARVRRNVAEAQEMLRDSFSWKLGAGRPVSAAAPSMSPEDVLSEAVSIILLICFAAMDWVLPVFWEPPGTGFGPWARAAGAHMFALCCIAAATFGVMARLARKAGSLR
jgi:hypothetical protein